MLRSDMLASASTSGANQRAEKMLRSDMLARASSSGAHQRAKKMLRSEMFVRDSAPPPRLSRRVTRSNPSNQREERVPEPRETERARGRGEEPYSRTVTTPDREIAKVSRGYGARS